MLPGGSGELDAAVVVAVVAVLTVQVAVDQVVGVVAVRDALVPAIRPVPVLTVVPAAGVGGSAVGGILPGDLEPVLVHVAAVHVVHVAVMQVVGVAVVVNGGMATPRAVLVRVTVVRLVVHLLPPPAWQAAPRNRLRPAHDCVDG